MKSGDALGPFARRSDRGIEKDEVLDAIQAVPDTISSNARNSSRLVSRFSATAR